MPKLKTHHWVGVTMSLKNCFGCMPGRVYGWPKDVFHVRGIPESILDIVAAVRPSLAIIDGIVGMQGDGPIMGDPVPSGVVVVSRDLVAADVTGARLMGMDPEKVRVPDGGGPLPRAGALGADRAARRGSRPRSTRSFRPAPGSRRLSRRRPGSGGRPSRQRAARPWRAWTASRDRRRRRDARRLGDAPDAEVVGAHVGLALTLGLDRARGRPLLLRARRCRAPPARPLDPPGRARLHRPRPEPRRRPRARRPRSHHARRGVSSIRCSSRPPGRCSTTALTPIRAATVINAFVMSLARSPGFLFASLFVAQRAAVLVAAGTVLVPTMAFTGIGDDRERRLSIVPRHPLAHRARRAVAERSGASWRRSARSALSAMTRTQGAVLAARAASSRRSSTRLTLDAGRASLVPHPTLAPTGVVVVGVALLRRRRSPAVAKATRCSVGGRASSAPPRSRRCRVRSRLHVGGLLLTVAVLPVLASLVMIVVGLSRSASEPQRLFAAIALPTLLARDRTRQPRRNRDRHRRVEGVNDSYVVYVVPVVLVGFAMWFESLRPPRSVALVFLVGAVVLLVPPPLRTTRRRMRRSTLRRSRRGSRCRTRSRRSRSAHARSVSGSPGSGSAGGGARAFAADGIVVERPRADRSGRPPAARANRCNAVRRIADLGSRRCAGGGGRPGALADVPCLDRRRGLLRPDDDGCPEPAPVGQILRLGSSTCYENVVPTVPVRVGDGGFLVTSPRTVVRPRFVLVPCSLRVAGRPWARIARTGA